MPSFENRTVVITGAASGIGRATALEFARKEANLVLIDVNKKGLQTLTKEIEQKGVKVQALEVDVTDLHGLERAVKKIEKEFGGIDILVNNAAIAVYGEVQDIPVEDMKRVFDVNVFGQIHCVKVMLPYLERPESMGRIIAIGSVLGEISSPLNSPYVASKHALQGFYKSFHEELLHRKSKVTVSKILPSSIATPLFTNAKTYLGVEPTVFHPLYSPYVIARKILKQASKPRRSTVSGIGACFIALYRLFPESYHRAQSILGYPMQRTHKPKSPEDENNLDDPVHESGEVYGDQWFFIPAVVAKYAKPHYLLAGFGIYKLLKGRSFNKGVLNLF